MRYSWTREHKGYVGDTRAPSRFLNDRTYNLELHGLALELNSANLEVYTNCADIALCVGVVGETKKQAGLRGRIDGRTASVRHPGELRGDKMGVARTTATHLADTGVTNEEELEEVVVLAGVHGRRRGLEAGGSAGEDLAGGRGGRG